VRAGAARHRPGLDSPAAPIPGRGVPAAGENGQSRTGCGSGRVVADGAALVACGALRRRFGRWPAPFRVRRRRGTYRSRSASPPRKRGTSETPALTSPGRNPRKEPAHYVIRSLSMIHCQSKIRARLS
jgi:hypothetical protein